MTERGGKGHQLGFEPMKDHDPLATHTILPGARIRVETKSGRGFAWATVTGDEFDAEIQDRKQEPHREPSMRLFLAMSAFSAYYSQHETTARYEGGTRFFAFPNPGDKTVMKIPKKRVAKK